MKPIKPIYIKLLIIAIAVWIVSTTLCLVDLYQKVGEIEHELMHIASGGHNH